MSSFINFPIPEVMRAVGKYFATKSADAVLAQLFGKDHTTPVDSQFGLCLKTALLKTCEHFNWEYDESAIDQTFKYSDELIKNSDSLQSALPRILAEAVGHPYSDQVVEIWMNSFVEALVLPQNRELYNTIMYYNTITPSKSSYSATDIYNYAVKPLEHFKNKAIWDKTQNRLHDLVDKYCDNSIICSSDFYLFFRNHLQLILPYNVKHYLADSFMANTYSALAAFSNIFIGSPGRERERALQFIESYLTCYVIALCGAESINISKETIASKINKIFISFGEQQTDLSLSSSSKEILNKAQATLEEFSAYLERELPFEMENGKTLSNVYIHPEYMFSGQRITRDNIFELIDSFINRRIKSFLNEYHVLDRLEFGYYHALFIIGSGGMGKSSLLAKLASNILAEGITQRIFFLKFSKFTDSSGNIIDDITASLNISEADLRQSIIVLDAYDEFALDTGYNKDSVIQDFCNALYRLDTLAIVTTRPGYIDVDAIGNSISISLCTFSKEKRIQWTWKYNPSIKPAVLRSIMDYRDQSDEKGCELIGTPIILYMVAANEININKFRSRFALYNRLFGAHGLWINRRYDENHPLLQNAQDEVFSLILDIALAIFNQKQGLSLSRNSIETLIEKRGFEDSKLAITLKRCYPLVTYFKNNVYLNELEFAHKSIYEFYVATKLYMEIVRTLKLDVVSADSVIGLAIQFKDNSLTTDILDFYLEMLRQMQGTRSLYQKALKSMEFLIESYLSIINNPLVQNTAQACNAFFNTFTAISEALNIFLPSDYIEVPQNELMESLRFYFGFSNYPGVVCLTHFNLSGFNLKRMNYNNVDFSYSNLEGADLSFGDFTKAIFYRANLRNANLYAATMSHAILKEADLRGAFLHAALFNKSEMSNFTGAKIDIGHLPFFAPEVFYQFDYFRIYSNETELSSKEKETTIQNMRGLK